SSAVRSRTSPARRSEASTRTPSSRSDRRTTSRCSRARRSSTAGRRSTSASASPAGLPSPTPPSSPERRRGSRSSPSWNASQERLVAAVDDPAEGVPVAGGPAAPPVEDELLHGEAALLRGLEHDPRIDERVLLRVHGAQGVHQARPRRVLAGVLQRVDERPGGAEAVRDVVV